MKSVGCRRRRKEKKNNKSYKQLINNKSLFERKIKNRCELVVVVNRPLGGPSDAQQIHEEDKGDKERGFLN